MTKEFSVNGTPILGLLGVSFVALKLFGVIDWSWWWVTAPFWGLPALIMVLGVILGISMICQRKTESYRRTLEA